VLKKTVLLAVISSSTLFAQEDKVATCSIPDEILMAIAKVESGYGGKPYPFLIGLNGKDIKKGKKILANFKGRWLEHRSFDCLEEENCVNAGSALIEQGVYNVDFGMFQINHYWHYKYARDIAAYFDFEESRQITCKVVEECVSRKSYGWEGIACYHSSTPSRNKIYAESLYKIITEKKN